MADTEYDEYGFPKGSGKVETGEKGGKSMFLFFSSTFILVCFFTGIFAVVVSYYDFKSLPRTERFPKMLLAYFFSFLYLPYRIFQTTFNKTIYGLL